MSENWYLMTTPNQMSGFENDYFTDYATDSFNELLSTFVGDDVTIYNSTLDVSSVVKGIVQSKDKKNEKQILLPLNSCSVGMYIKYKNLYWLITEFVNDNKMYQNAVMQLCTYTLKFQSPTGTILSYPCITSTKSFNQDETKVITLNSNQKSILLPFDDNTKLLTTDRRFYVDRLNNTTWHIVGGVDNTTYAYGDKGLIYFIVEQDVEQNTNQYPDRPDLGVCNYFEPIVEPEPPVEGYSYATIMCSGDIVVGGVTRTITPIFYESDNTIATGITAIWDIDLPLGYENQFTITYVDNQVKIKVAENYDLIEKTITFNVMGSSGGYGGSSTLTITV